jgi:LCP family protein required for cell wall assembly
VVPTGATAAPPVGPRRRGRRRAARSFRSTLGWTVLGALLPGTAFLAAGRRVLGAGTLLLFLLLAGGGVWLALGGGQQAAIGAALDTGALLWALGGVVAVALIWIAVVVSGYRMLLAADTARGRRVAGGLVVGVLVLCIVVPTVMVGQVAAAQRDLIAEVFDDGDSATVIDTPDPFGDKERVNVLLLGSDGGEGRDGVRTDTVIVASIDTDTGDTTLISLPRNLEDLPFPADSPLAEAYPDGFDAGSESESLLNAVYRNGPAEHPDILGPTDDPGADFLKLGVGEALGLTLDYYVLVNLEGFSRLVDALGGITVNVNYYVPIGGDPGTGALPDDYIAPGPNQLLDGPRALDFARGRFGLTDYDRMARQRCTIDAIVDAADPGTVLRQYQELAATTRDIVSTDIPRSALADFVELGFLVKDAEIRSLVFDATVIDPAYPDFDEMRALVQQALSPHPAPAPDDAPAPAEPTDAPPPSEGPDAPTENPVAEVGDACAYDPVQAEQALAAGEPPTHRR